MSSRVFQIFGNVFFKIVIAFVILSFALFGVSNFILGNPNSWVVKVGSSTISVSDLNKTMRNEREQILQSRHDEEVMKYLESDQFRSDVLGRMVNELIIDKLREDFGVNADKKLILKAVAEDRNFHGPDGKFDRKLFEAFLAQSGFNEEKYVKALSDEISAMLIMQSLSMVSPYNEKLTAEFENFKKEKRVADMITISAKDVKSVAKPSESEIADFYEKNKTSYAVPEFRDVSYVKFSDKIFASEFIVSDSDIAKEYEANKDKYSSPETRDFYQVLFDKKEKAEEFVQKLNAKSVNKTEQNQTEFLTLVKEILKKGQKDVAITGVAQEQLMPEIAPAVFQLGLNENSAVLSSSFGFHVFLLTKINPAAPIALDKVKAEIKKSLEVGKKERVIEDKISQINDVLLTSNSLDEAMKKFNLGVKSEVKIDALGRDKNGVLVKSIETLNEFSTNAFALKDGQASQVFYDDNAAEFYALKVNKVEPGYSQELVKVKDRITADLTEENRVKAMRDLAAKIAEEVKTNPDKLSEISAKHGVKLEKGREFPRAIYATIGGRKISYPSKFLDELFGLQVGQATSLNNSGKDELSIGVLREIKKFSATVPEVKMATQESIKNFRNEVLQEFNAFLLKKHPVQINEKVLRGLEKQQ
jgi:peptidyl-prolyl cis-trans isomerase D